MRRREMIAGLGASWAVSLPIASAVAQVVPTPDMNALGTCVLTMTGDDGPFYFDAKLVRHDIAEHKPGVPLQLAIRVVTADDCKEIKGARTDLWHADAYGLYSGYDKQTGVGGQRKLSTVGKTFLRGTQFTDTTGTAAFQTIYPSWYRGRTPHIHFKVFLDGKHVVTNQIIFPEEINDAVLRRKPYNQHSYVRDTRNANDSYLKLDSSGVLCRIEPQGAGYLATLSIGVRKG